MSLIEINPDLKEATKQLARIADALHALLREAYGVHLEPVRADLSTAGDRHEVFYASDEETFKQDLLDARDGLSTDRPIEADELDRNV